MRKLLLTLVITMIIGLVFVVVKAVQERTASGDSSPTSTTAAPHASATPNSGTLPSSRRRSRQTAVTAAARALENLTGAFLKNNDQRWIVIRRIVIPKYRRRYNRQMNRIANPHPTYRAFWGTGTNGWGYESRLQALVRSHYRSDVQYYHVDKFRPGKARIALYYVTTYFDTNQSQHEVIDMQVVTMRWAQRRWRYVRQRDPAKYRTPGIKPRDDLTPPEIANLWKPYLKPKGFVQYQN